MLHDSKRKILTYKISPHYSNKKIKAAIGIWKRNKTSEMSNASNENGSCKYAVAQKLQIAARLNLRPP